MIKIKEFKTDWGITELFLEPHKSFAPALDDFLVIENGILVAVYNTQEIAIKRILEYIEKVKKGQLF